MRAAFPQHQWPARRRYTVRAWDAASRLLTIDFVVHGDEGVAGSWAAAAEPGGVLVFKGPSGGYTPDPTADWHLMVGDESALPAIAASLEAIPIGALAVVRLICDGPEYELALSSAGRLDVRWLQRRGGSEDTTLLATELRALPFPRGRVQPCCSPVSRSRHQSLGPVWEAFLASPSRTAAYRGKAERGGFLPESK